MPPVELLLASTSAYRAELLARLMVPFKQIEPDYKEEGASEAEQAESPMQTALRHSVGKATSVAAIHQNSRQVVIGSDQVAVCGDMTLHKPGSADRAIAQLQACSGRWVEFNTGIALIRPGSGKFTEGESYRVKFRDLTNREIQEYVALDNPIYSAGAIKAESLGISLFAKLDGGDVTALYGLPLMLLCRGFQELGLELSAFRQQSK